MISDLAVRLPEPGRFFNPLVSLLTRSQYINNKEEPRKGTDRMQKLFEVIVKALKEAGVRMSLELRAGY